MAAPFSHRCCGETQGISFYDHENVKKDKGELTNGTPIGNNSRGVLPESSPSTLRLSPKGLGNQTEIKSSAMRQPWQGGCQLFLVMVPEAASWRCSGRVLAGLPRIRWNMPTHGPSLIQCSSPATWGLPWRVVSPGERPAKRVRHATAFGSVVSTDSIPRQTKGVNTPGPGAIRVDRAVLSAVDEGTG